MAYKFSKTLLVSFIRDLLAVDMYEDLWIAVSYSNLFSSYMCMLCILSYSVNSS